MPLRRVVVEKQLSDVDEDCHGDSLDKVITKKKFFLVGCLILSFIFYDFCTCFGQKSAEEMSQWQPLVRDKKLFFSYAVSLTSVLQDPYDHLGVAGWTSTA